MSITPVWFLTGLAWLAFGAAAREIVVGPAEIEPVISRALESADDGDTIRISPGRYRETLVVRNRVALVGEPGAVLDPSEPFRPQWKPATDLGPDVYRAAVDRKPRALFLDGKVLAEIDERRTKDPGDWSWKKLLSSGPPRAGFKFIRTIWTYRSDENAIYLHLADDADPTPLDWSVLWTSDPVVAFRGAVGASIRGVTIARGYRGVALLDNSHECTVSNCVVGPFEKTGVHVGGGSSNCLIEKNEIFRGAYEDWVPRDNSRERYEIWQVHKNAGFYDRIGIDLLRAGRDNRVHANHIYETFDGITLGDSSVESLDIPLTHPDHGRGTRIWENLIERTRDSGIELGVGCIDVHVHHNTLRQTHGGLRFKLPRIGPVFIYRNVLEGGTPFNIWYSMDDSPAEGYVYHNTIVGGSTGLWYNGFNKPHHIGAPNWHYLNNLVLADKGFFGTRSKEIPVNFTADHNVVTGGGKPWPTDPSKDQHSRYVQRVELDKDLRPAPDSSAIDAGRDLSTYFHGKPLPGCEPGSFKGPAPDAGAFEVK